MELTNEWAQLPYLVQMPTGTPVMVSGRKIGYQFEFETDNPSLLFTLSHISESRDGTPRAEVLVEAIHIGRHGHVMRDGLNLVSGRSRSSLAKALRERANPEVPWGDILEVICDTTLRVWREGEPFLDLMEVEPAPADAYLIDRLLAQGEVTVIYGDGMSGKSLMAISMAICVASRIDLPGLRLRGDAGTALYLDWETRADTHSDFVRRIGLGHHLAVPNRAIIYRSMSRSLIDDLVKVKDQVDRHDIKLVVVDSMIPACGGEPEGSEGVRHFFNALRELGDCTKCVISHVTKAEAEREGIPRPFGSVFTTNLARSTWAVKRSMEEESSLLHIALHHTKVNRGRLFAPMGLCYDFHDDAPHRPITIEIFDLETVPELDRHTPLSRRIRSVLRGGAMTTDEIAEELNANEDSVRRALTRMRGTKRLEKGGGKGKRTLWGLESKHEEPEDQLSF